MTDRIADRIAARDRARAEVERKRNEHIRKERRARRVNFLLVNIAGFLTLTSALLFIISIWGGDPRPAFTALVLAPIALVVAIAALVMWFVRQW